MLFYRLIKNIWLTGFILLLWNMPVAAGNNQTLVIGGGIGLWDYSSSDDVRGDNINIPADTRVNNNANTTELFLEYYLIDDTGIGYRDINISSSRTISDVPEYEETVEVRYQLYTAQWILFGEDSYYRLGVFGGLGDAEYTYDTKSPLYAGKYTVDGLAQTFGLFFDWGIDGLGSRISYYFIETQFEDITLNNSYGNRKIDGSGEMISFTVRWAFGDAPKLN